MDCVCKTQQNQESLYSRLFARLYDHILASAEKQVLSAHRRKLLADFSGEILEIGCGTGVNFSYYPSGAKVTAIEPSYSMLEYAHRKAKDSKATIQLLQSGIEDFAGTLHKQGKQKISSVQIQDKKYDAVLATLVLCTVPDLELALRHILGLLKKGGRLFVLEHIRSHKRLGSVFQASLRPLWKCCGQGCILNRPTDRVLLNEPSLRPLEIEYFTSTLPFFRGVFERC